jgi:hypothetical protein
MTTLDLRAPAQRQGVDVTAASPTRLLASALLHLVDRDEPVPARWRSEAFAASVARHRTVLETIDAEETLDRLARVTTVSSFGGAVSALSRDPFAAALAVRRLELTRGEPLPAWDELVRHGVPPLALPVEQLR